MRSLIWQVEDLEAVRLEAAGASTPHSRAPPSVPPRSPAPRSPRDSRRTPGFVNGAPPPPPLPGFVNGPQPHYYSQGMHMHMGMPPGMSRAGSSPLTKPGAGSSVPTCHIRDGSSVPLSAGRPSSVLPVGKGRAGSVPPAPGTKYMQDI